MNYEPYEPESIYDRPVWVHRDADGHLYKPSNRPFTSNGTWNLAPPPTPCQRDGHLLDRDHCTVGKDGRGLCASCVVCGDRFTIPLIVGGPTGVVARHLTDRLFAGDQDRTPQELVELVLEFAERVDADIDFLEEVAEQLELARRWIGQTVADAG